MRTLEDCQSTSDFEQEMRQELLPEDRLCLDHDPALDGEASMQPSPSWNSSPGTSALEDTVELLKNEIALLQAELSARETVSAAGGDAPTVTRTNVDERIQRLLFELDQSDHRVAALEEVARLSEETRYAEAEEKSQLERWVGEIERRVAEKEQEIQAESEILRGRLANAVTERSAAIDQIDQLICQEREDPAFEDILEVQRRDNEALRDRAARFEDHCRQLEKRCQQLEEQNSKGFIQAQITDAVRAERLQLAQERAALSRRELELAGKIKELQMKIETQSKTHDVDDRFRAFKEQLSKLHEQDKETVAPETMCQRLVRLWHRLDGPTDHE